MMFVNDAAQTQRGSAENHYSDERKKNGDDGKRTCWVREAENTHTITQAHTAHCVCWFVCVCVRETALQLTYRLHIKVNLY